MGSLVVELVLLFAFSPHQVRTKVSLSLQHWELQRGSVWQQLSVGNTIMIM